jgi:hypothetical protein
MSSLDDLRDLSLTIIKSAIHHPLGLAKLTPHAGGEVPFTPKERRLLDLHHELDTLSRRIVEARESTGIAEKSTRFIFMRKINARRKTYTWRSRNIGIIVIGKTRGGAS